MPTILLLDDGEERVRRLEKSLRDALPQMRICHVRSAIEFRYALVTESPKVVILGRPASPDRVVNLAWEVAGLTPRANLMILSENPTDRDAWSSLGDAISDVVDESGLLGAVSAAVRAPTTAMPRTNRTSLSIADVASGTVDSHRLKNRLAGLLAGLHALAAELSAAASDTERIPGIADEYVDRLVDVVGDICAMVAAAEARPCDENHT